MSICEAADKMTVRVLMTGANGFVGPHVERALRRACGAEIEIIATSKAGGTHPLFGEMDALDVTDAPPCTRPLPETIPATSFILPGSQRLLPPPRSPRRRGPYMSAERAMLRTPSSTAHHGAGCSMSDRD